MYTEDSLRRELGLIYRNPSDGFMWEDKEKPKLGNQATLDDFMKYCWAAYDKAFKASGPQVIGRISDIHQTLQRKISNILQGQTLLDTATQGNILRMDKWCLAMNDCWLLGGVHRGAEFELMSDFVWKNVWNPDINSFVVTAREIIGLKTAGYRRETGKNLGPGSQGRASYVSGDRSKAMSLDLEEYQLAVAMRESRGPLGATDLIG